MCENRAVTITAAADGSALGNPGPAGWAWFVDDTCWAAGGWDHGTNNMGELMAVLDLLQQTAHLDTDLHVLCDSVYTINVITKWMQGWKRKGWKKGDGKPVQNLELIKFLDEAMTGRRVRFEWVKGHAGHELNTHADRLAHAAATAFQRGEPVEAGPGFAGSRVAHPDVTLAEPTPAPVAEPDLFSVDLLESSSELPPAEEDLVVQLERDLLSDEVRGDPSQVAALLHEDWAEVGASGRLWSRTELLAAIAPVEAQFDLVSVDRVTPETILVVWRSVTANGSALRSSWWVRQGGNWRQRFHQGTPEP